MLLNRRWISSILALGLWLLAGSGAFAQATSMFGANGATTGASGFGTGTTGNSSTGNATASTAFATAGKSTGQGAATGVGGQQGVGGQPGQQGVGMGGQAGQGFLGAANNPNAAGFLGAAQQGGQQGRGGQQQFGLGQQGGRGGQGNRGMQQQQFMNQGQQGNQQQAMKVRPQLRVDFDFKKPLPEATASKIQARFDQQKTRFERLKENSQFDDVDFDVQGSTVVLTGQVDSPRAKRLATLLAQMEQGVRKVDNKLTVRNPPAPAPEDEARQ